MYLQSQPGYVIIQDFDGGAFHNSEKPATLEHIQEVLRRISNTDVTINALHIATTWTDRARQATTYRNGRIFLAGDAAHIHAPLGVRGAMNEIIRDLINTRDGAIYIAGRVWGVFTHYDLGGDHPLAGHSISNFEFGDGARIGELMHDGQGILLDFDRNASLEALANKYGGGLQRTPKGCRPLVLFVIQGDLPGHTPPISLFSAIAPHLPMTYFCKIRI